MKLKEKLKRLVSKKSIDRMIDGETFTFHPVSLLMLSEMGEVFAPVVSAVRLLFNQDAKPRAVTTEKIKQPDGTEVETVHAAEMSDTMVRLVEAQQDEAITRAIKCLLGPESREMLVRLLASSLRCPEDEVREALDEMDLGTLGQLLGGFLEANGKVFGPFVQQAKAWLKRRNLRLVPGDAVPEAGEEGQSPLGKNPSES